MNKIAYTAFVVFVTAILTLVLTHILSGPPAPRSVHPVPPTEARPPSEGIAESQEKRTRAITTVELARHGKPENCWMAIRGKVYDVTAYIPRHPTPPAILHMYCGTDATEGWETKGHGRPHSETAEAMLDEYFVGVLAEN